jgi:O-antigen ligase
MEQKSHYWSFLFFASLIYYVALLPWQVQWLPATLGIMLAGLFWLISANFKAKMRLLGASRSASLFFGLYLLVALGAFYTTESKEASQELFSKIPFLAWPLMFGGLMPFSTSRFNHVVRFFIGSAALLIFASFSYAILRYFNGAGPSVFYFSELLTISKVPPHYLGMYVTFAYALTLYRLIKGSPLFKASWFNIFLLALFTLAIVFIWVRMQYLLFVLTNAYLVAHFVKIRRGRNASVLSFAALGLVFGSLLMAIPGSRSRLVDTYNELRSFEQMIENKQTNPRKFLWREGLEVIKENFWTGVGTGAENTALNTRLKEVDAIFWDGKHTYQLHEMNFNYHNSFLQIFAANGVFAFLLLIVLLFYPLFTLKQHPYRTEIRLFLLICIFSFLTESMLQRQAGVLFFSFFYCFLISVPYGKSLDHKILKKYQSDKNKSSI